MTTKLTAIALVLASSLIASTSFADVTREQVRVELAAAIRTGDILAGGDSGLKLNEMYPERYPSKQARAGLTREQVQAELTEAIRTGDNLVGGEISGKCRDVHPNMHSLT